MTMAHAKKSIDHLSAFLRSMERYTNTLDRSDMKKAVNHGVRAAIAFAGNEQADPQHVFNLFESVRACMAVLTPNELMQIFPVDKEYDGDRWETKDYFYTMDVLRKHGLDTPIGERVDHLMWDYMNMHTRIFTVEYTSVASKLYRNMTGESIIEKFCRDTGIELAPVDAEPVRTFPAYLKLLHGGQGGDTVH